MHAVVIGKSMYRLIIKQSKKIKLSFKNYGVIQTPMILL